MLRFGAVKCWSLLREKLHGKGDAFDAYSGYHADMVARQLSVRRSGTLLGAGCSIVPMWNITHVCPSPLPCCFWTNLNLTVFPR